MAQPVIAGIVTSCSTSLNDQEPGFQFVRWPIAELTGYFNEALNQVAEYRPDSFTQTVQLTLAPGRHQVLAAEASGVPTGSTAVFLKSLDANTTGACDNAPISQCDLNLLKSFYKKPCDPTGGITEYRVISYAYDPRSPQEFFVSPPVPAGTSIGVAATVMLTPPQFTQTGGAGSLTWTPTVDLDPTSYPNFQRYINAVKFWILARAYEVDTESATSQAESKSYYQKFFNLLGVNFKQSTDYSKGTFLGQGGVNQMVKQRPL